MLSRAAGKLALRVLLPDLFPGGQPRPAGAKPTAAPSAPSGGTAKPGTTTTTSGGGSSTAPVTPTTAVSDISGLIKTNAGACGITSWNIKGTGTTGNVSVTATVAGSHAGTATWTVTSAGAKPTNALASSISAGCA